MYTTNIFRHLVWGALVLGVSQAQGQATVLGHFGGPGDHLGWNASTPQALEVRHDGPYSIEWYTDAIQRMRLNHSLTYTIGGFFNQNANGYLGLSPNNTLWTSAPGPFSRLHLHDGLTGVLQAGYRPWMDNGITFTTNFDQMYIGHKVEPGDDQTAAVIQWSDNELAPAGPDVLKFIFTSNYTGASGINSMDGREIARMHPTGWLGIGDWQAAGLQPDERLDVLTRTIRLREFSHPTWWRNDTYDRILVANPADGRVYWRDANTLGGDDCDWVEQTQGPSGLPHVSSVYPGTQCQWDDTHGVGIGLHTPKAKLHVFHQRDELLSPTAIIAQSWFDYDQGQSVVGTFSEARPTNTQDAILGMQAFGMLSVPPPLHNGHTVCWVLERWPMRLVARPACSMALWVLPTANDNAAICVGVYGTASGASGGQNWAIWFQT
jgi:hypothetical protein